MLRSLLDPSPPKPERSFPCCWVFLAEIQLSLSPSLGPLFGDSLCSMTGLCRGTKSWPQVGSVGATVVNDLWFNSSPRPSTPPSLPTGVALNHISNKLYLCLRVCFLGNLTCNSVSTIGIQIVLFPGYSMGFTYFFHSVICPSFILHSSLPSIPSFLHSTKRFWVSWTYV